jgi:hypothetical protein
VTTAIDPSVLAVSKVKTMETGVGLALPTFTVPKFPFDDATSKT